MKPDSEPVLAKSRPSVSVMDYRPDEILDFLRQKLRRRGVKAAWLFGSLSAGTAHSWSDIDVMIVQDSDLPFIERPRMFDDLFELGIPVDILVYTPAEFDMMEAAGSGFWKDTAKSRIRVV